MSRCLGRPAPLARCLLTAFLGFSCGCNPSCRTERAINSAIADLRDESSSWQEVLQNLERELSTSAQSTVRNEVDTVLTRAIAASGSEVMCVNEFIRDRVQQDLARILARLQGRVPDPVYPSFCQVVPAAVDSLLVPQNLSLLQLFGYDFDRAPVKVFLEDTSAQRRDVTSHLDFPTHFHMTLALGAGGVELAPSSRRLVFVWAGRDQASVAVVHTPPPPISPTYIISIRTWDLEHGSAAEDGRVRVRIIGTVSNSLFVRVAGDFRRGEIESASVTMPDLGAVRSVVVEYDDGAENNAWALDWVRVERSPGGPKWHCPATTWLGHQAPQTKTFACNQQ